MGQGFRQLAEGQYNYCKVEQGVQNTHQSAGFEYCHGGGTLQADRGDLISGIGISMWLWWEATSSSSVGMMYKILRIYCGQLSRHPTDGRSKIDSVVLLMIMIQVDGMYRAGE